jgi:hypothetical protein
MPDTKVFNLVADLFRKLAKLYSLQVTLQLLVRALAVCLVLASAYIVALPFTDKYPHKPTMIFIITAAGAFLLVVLLLTVGDWIEWRFRRTSEGLSVSSPQDGFGRARRRENRRYAVVAYCLFAGIYFSVLSVIGNDSIRSPWKALTTLIIGTALFMIGYGIDKEISRHLALKWLGEVFPAIAMLKARSDEYRKRVEDVNRVLSGFKPAGPRATPLLQQDKINLIASHPPLQAEEDVKICCQKIADSSAGGLDSGLLRLLYHGRPGAPEEESKERKELWPLSDRDQFKLAHLLAKDERLTRFKPRYKSVLPLKRLFSHVEEFRFDQVRDEMRSLIALWEILEQYSGYLYCSSANSGKVERAFSPADLTEFLDGLPSNPEVAEDGLVRASERWFDDWFNAWGKQHFPGLTPHPKSSGPAARQRSDLDRMALVGLGIFAAEQADAGGFQLSRSRMREIAHDGIARQMLFGYLWKKSQSEVSEVCGLDALSDWKNSVAKAHRKLGYEFCVQMREMMRFRLERGQWPTSLPVKRLIQEHTRIRAALDNNINRGSDGRRIMTDVLMGLGGQFAQLCFTFEKLPDKDFFLKVSEIIDKRSQLDKQAEATAAHAMEPEAPEIEALPERQPDRPPGGGSSRRLVPEDGSSEYLITFDQTRGPLAALIDLLRDKYGFDHYTRYGRIGALEPGQSFADFYRQFKADLEAAFQAATCAASAGAPSWLSPLKLKHVRAQLKESQWEMVEITVQQIFRRQNFLPSRLESIPRFHKSFRLVPSWIDAPLRTRPLIIDPVHFAVSFHRTVAPGTTFRVMVWAFTEDQRDEMRRQAEAALQEDHHSGRLSARKAAGHEPAFQIRLLIKDASIKPHESLIAWDGEVREAAFAVTLPAGSVHNPCPAVAEIYAGGLQVAKVHFALDVEGETAGPAALTTREERYHTAFASYAEGDRDAVLERVQKIRRIVPDLQVSMDVIQLRSGHHWEQELWNQVPSHDVFYLFWSAEAKRSKRVEEEWRCALQARGRNFIEPVQLVPSDSAPLPAELSVHPSEGPKSRAA